MKLDPRIFTRCEGYWRRSPLDAKERLAWEHLLADIDPERVLSALDDYARRPGSHRPPLAGQLADLATRPAPPKDTTPVENPDEICAAIVATVGQDVYDTWLAGLNLSQVDGRLIIEIPTSRALGWIELRYLRALKSTAEQLGFTSLEAVALESSAAA